MSKSLTLAMDTSHDMFKHIEPDYFGIRDAESDAALRQDEAALEAKLQQQAIDEWNRAERERTAQVAALVRA